MDDAAAAARDGADAFDRLEISARNAGRAMQAAFALASAEGARLEDVLRNVGLRLAQMALQAGGQAAGGLLSGGLSAALSGLASGGLAGVGENVAAGALPPPAAAGALKAVNVVMNVSTPDAESFRRGEAQVAAALSRAVARGARGS